MVLYCVQFFRARFSVPVFGQSWMSQNETRLAAPDLPTIDQQALVDWHIAADTNLHSKCRSKERKQSNPHAMDEPRPPEPLETESAYVIHEPEEEVPVTQHTNLQASLRRLHATVQEPGHNLLSYIKSASFIELVVCIVWKYWGCRASLFWMKVTERSVQYVNLDDGSILWDFRFSEENVSPSWPGKHLGRNTMTIPLLILVCLSLLCRRYSEVHASICVYYFAMGTTWMVTNLLKQYVGYLRPNFLEFCKYNEYCEDDDARNSFPSGHSSLAFCGMTILSLFIHRHFGLPRHQLDFRKRYVSILSLLPMGFAAIIACSRVVDNKHFPADITAGSIIGAAIGYFCYNLWFFADKDLVDA